MMVEVMPGTEQLVEQAKAALRAGDAAAARTAIEPLTSVDTNTGGVREIQARADYLDLDFAAAITGWERAYAAYRAAGLRDITVTAETMTSTDPARTVVPPFTTMAAHAERCGAVGDGCGDTWLTQLADAGRQGRFFWALTMFAVAGTRA